MSVTGPGCEHCDGGRVTTPEGDERPCDRCGGYSQFRRASEPVRLLDAPVDPAAFRLARERAALLAMLREELERAPRAAYVVREDAPDARDVARERDALFNVAASLLAERDEARAQLAVTEAEARTALDALHARCDAAEAAAALAAETHGRDLAAIADVLGMAPTTAARFDAGAVWWRARSAWLLLQRNGLAEKAAANDASLPTKYVTPDATPDGESDPAALCGELARLRAFVDSLGAKDVPCECGSGAHPRECERHPWGYRLHVAEMQAECAQTDEDVEKAEAERDEWKARALRAEAALKAAQPAAPHNHDRAQLAALEFAEQHKYAAGAIMGGIAHREDVTCE